MERRAMKRKVHPKYAELTRRDLETDRFDKRFPASLRRADFSEDAWNTLRHALREDPDPYPHVTSGQLAVYKAALIERGAEKARRELPRVYAHVEEERCEMCRIFLDETAPLPRK